MNDAPAKSKTPMLNLLVAAFLFLLYVRPYENLTFLIPFQLTRVFMVMAIIGCMLNGFNSKFNKRSLMTENSVKWYFILQAMTLLSVFFSVWASNTIGRFKETNMRITITFLVISSLLYNRHQILFFVKVIFVSLFFFALRIIWAFKSGQYIFDYGVKRIVGVGTLGSSDPNDVALVLAMAIPLGLYYMFVKRGGKRLIYAGLFVTILVALVVTGSRGGLLGLGLGVMTFFAILYRKQKGKFIGTFVVLALAAVLFLPGEYKGRFMSMFDEQEYSHSDEKHGRVAIWKRGWAAMLQRPIGYGGGNSLIAEGAQKQEAGVQGKWMVIHNSYLQMGMDLGFLGLLIYLLFLRTGFTNAMYVLNHAVKNKDREFEVLACGLAGGLMAFMVSGFFLSQAYNWNPYIYIALTMGLKRNTIANEKSEKK